MTLVNSGLVVLVAVRVRVTTFCPPISVASCAWAAVTSEPANKAGSARSIKGARKEAFISIHPLKCIKIFRNRLPRGTHFAHFEKAYS